MCSDFDLNTLWTVNHYRVDIRSCACQLNDPLTRYDGKNKVRAFVVYLNGVLLVYLSYTSVFVYLYASIFSFLYGRFANISFHFFPLFINFSRVRRYTLRWLKVFIRSYLVFTPGFLSEDVGSAEKFSHFHRRTSIATFYEETI